MRLLLLQKHYLCKNEQKRSGMKHLFLLLCSVMLAMEISAQGLAGAWNGRLDVGGEKLRLVVHLTPEAEGWKATMDSPDQGARGIPFDVVEVAANTVSLQAQALQLRIDLVLWGADHLMGSFSQGSLTTSLLLQRGVGERPKRPQAPQPPYPYRAEEVSFMGRDGQVELHGTLTCPAAAGRYPAVVLVTGSGTQNRDEELFDHKPFLLLADRLTRAGYVVLRYDDRGYNASPEELERLKYATTADMMQDALGAFDYLTKRAEADPAKVGILGHSEGGTIAFLAAAEEPRVAFILSMAGMTVSGAELLVEQNRALMTQQGVPAPIVEAYGTALQRLYEAWQQHSPAELTAEKARFAAQAAAGLQLPEALLRNLEQIAALAEQQPWLDYFVRLDPSEAIRKLGSRPCLAMNGTKDLQVDAERNLGRLEALMQGAATVQLNRYEGLNHLFQPCTTGSVQEYGQIETTIDEQVLSDLVQWLNDQIGS